MSVAFLNFFFINNIFIIFQLWARCLLLVLVRRRMGSNNVSCMCVCVCISTWCITDRSGSWRSSEPLFSLAEISGPQGPVPQRELCYPLECFIVPQITPVERGKKQHGKYRACIMSMSEMTAALSRNSSRQASQTLHVSSWRSVPDMWLSMFKTNKSILIM